MPARPCPLVPRGLAGGLAVVGDRELHDVGPVADHDAWLAPGWACLRVLVRASWTTGTPRGLSRGEGPGGRPRRRVAPGDRPRGPGRPACQGRRCPAAGPGPGPVRHGAAVPAAAAGPPARPARCPRSRAAPPAPGRAAGPGPARRRGLDHHQAHAVRDDVVQVAGQAGPLGGHRRLGFGVSLGLQQPRAVSQHGVGAAHGCAARIRRTRAS